MNPSSSSENQDNDRKQKRKATTEPETKPKKIKITYDPLKVNPMEARLSGNYSRRVFQPPGESPPSSPSSSSSFYLQDSTSSSSDLSSPSTHTNEISSFSPAENVVSDKDCGRSASESSLPDPSPGSPRSSQC